MPGQCVNPADVASYLHQRLDGNVVGYSFTLGGGDAPTVPGHGGQARTSSTSPAVAAAPFETSTMFSPASVAKLFTAIAAVRMLDNPPTGSGLGRNLDSPIGGVPASSTSPAVPSSLPDGWRPGDIGIGSTPVSGSVATITIRQLLSHTSGITPPGITLPKGTGQDFLGLQAYFCAPGLAVTPGQYNYSDIGYAFFRLLLPIIDGMADARKSPIAVRATNFATRFAAIINREVFEPVGVTGPDSTGTGTYAYAYGFPGTGPGVDWNTVPEASALYAGAGAGWFLSIDDFTPVLDSLNRVDGAIVTAQQWTDMQVGVADATGVSRPLGLDNLVDPDPPSYRWVQKNGGDEHGYSGASCAFFGSTTGPAPIKNAPLYGALFVNSPISSSISGGLNAQNSWYACQKCFGLFYVGNGDGKCPGGVPTDAEKGNHKSWGEYVLSLVKLPDSQGNWKYCDKCQALCFVDGNSASVCSADLGTPKGKHTCPLGMYFLAQPTTPPSEDQQNVWRLCTSCGVLNVGAGAPCTSPGGKHTNGTVAYTLQETVGPDTVLREAFENAVKPCPDPCQGIRDELANLSSGDFQNFAAYQSAREALIAELAHCEQLHG
jgi:CubicO group peptidase (beta-lactamase class C family)